MMVGGRGRECVCVWEKENSNSERGVKVVKTEGRILLAAGEEESSTEVESKSKSSSKYPSEREGVTGSDYYWE